MPRPGVSTWWASICSRLAAVEIYDGKVHKVFATHEALDKVPHADLLDAEA